LPRARLGESAHLGRRGLLSEMPGGLFEDTRATTPIPDVDPLRLSVRLRALSGPRATYLSCADRAGRRVQPGVPDLLRVERTVAHALAEPRRDQGHAGRARPKRAGARRAAALGRRADVAPRFLRG